MESGGIPGQGQAVCAVAWRMPNDPQTAGGPEESRWVAAVRVFVNTHLSRLSRSLEQAEQLTQQRHAALHKGGQVPQEVFETTPSAWSRWPGFCRGWGRVAL